MFFFSGVCVFGFIGEVGILTCFFFLLVAVDLRIARLLPPFRAFERIRLRVEIEGYSIVTNPNRIQTNCSYCICPGDDREAGIRPRFAIGTEIPATPSRPT